jgi:hypothetical protein
LNAEERDLAQRLARLGGPREPAPALDATILAAARAAVSNTSGPATATPAEAPADPKITPLRPRKPTPRWPLGMGLAASLVLAVGIGWRLQGDGEGSSKDFGASSSPAAVFHEEATEAVILEPPLQRAPPPPPPPMESAADAVARRADVAQAPLPNTAPAASSKPDFVADAEMAEPVVSAEAPAASPPAGASANAVAADDALDSVTVTGSRVERAVGAAEYTRTPLNDRREQALSQPEGKTAVGGTAAPARPAAAPPPPLGQTRQNERARASVDKSEADTEARKVRDSDAFDASPPVTADSPEFRQAWLQRIRGHIAKGEQDAARSSLQEFRRRYPDIELPEDLRALAATLPAP